MGIFPRPEGGGGLQAWRWGGGMGSRPGGGGFNSMRWAEVGGWGGTGAPDQS